MDLELRPYLRALLVGCTACSSANSTSKDGGSDAGTRASTDHYSGLLAGPGGESGVLEVIVPVASAAGGLRTQALPAGQVSGTLTLGSDAGPINLSGVVDASGASLTFSGAASGALGNFNCTGQLESGSLRGQCTGADGTTRPFDSARIGISSIVRYCGTFMGGTPQIMGSFNLLTSGGTAAAVYWTPRLSGVAAGTLSGSQLSLSIPGGGTIAGAADGTISSGTWDVPAVGNGTFRASIHGCPGATGAMDGGVGAEDAGLSTGTGLSIDAGTSTDAGTSIDAGPAGDAGPVVLVSDGLGKDFLRVVAQHIVYANYEGTEVVEVDDLGMNRRVVDSCEGGCRGIVASGTEAFYWSATGVLKKFTVPGGAPTTLSPLGGNPNDAFCDDTYLYFRNQGVGGLVRLRQDGDTSGTAYAPGLDIGGYDAQGSTIFLSRQSGTHVLQSIDNAFTTPATNLISFGLVAPDDQGSAVVADGQGVYFMTTTFARPSVAHLWALVSGPNIEWMTTTSNFRRPLIDAGRLYWVATSSGTSEIVSIERSARQADAAVVASFGTEVINDVAQDANFIYAGIARRIVRIPKPQ